MTSIFQYIHLKWVYFLLLLLFSYFPKRTEQAVVRDSLQALLPELEGRKQYKWIGQRVRSMEEIWVKAGRSLSEKYSLAQRTAKQVEHLSVWKGSEGSPTGFHRPGSGTDGSRP